MMQRSRTGACAACQSTHGDLIAGSGRRLTPTPILVLWWSVTHRGIPATMRLVWSKICRICRGDQEPRVVRVNKTASPCCQEELNLQRGELVQVKSEQEILETLDEHGRHRGLLWMPAMARFCGNTYRVHKRLETIMLESTGELRRVRNTVLLENVMCEDLYGCDRSCFHYWREAWLRRVS
jgi:hypothetical protein